MLPFKPRSDSKMFPLDSHLSPYTTVNCSNKAVIPPTGALQTSIARVMYIDYVCVGRGDVTLFLITPSIPLQ